MTYAWIDGGEGRKVFRRIRDDKPARSDLPFPMIMSDQIELKSMVDGRIYTSKAALRASYREKGYVEVGNEALKPAPKPKPDRKAVRDALGRAFNRAGIAL